MSLHLVQTNIFHHLWFLWFLCWLVAAFAILAITGLLPTGRGRWWLVAASCVPQLVMGMSMAAGYGPDTSFGILPRPHLLIFYACFYFFGVATFAAEGLDTRLGRRWKLLVPTAIVLLVAGIATMNDRVLASVLQPTYAWAMSLGLIGLFSRICPRPSPIISWLADASYWMYLVHPPVVMVAQMTVRPWAMPADLKFLVVMAMVTPVLLLSYHYVVRFTVIGRLLNGPRDATTARAASPAKRSVEQVSACCTANSARSAFNSRSVSAACRTAPCPSVGHGPVSWYGTPRGPGTRQINQACPLGKAKTIAPDTAAAGRGLGVGGRPDFNSLRAVAAA